ncbi:lamin tail domain-containing protein [Halorussus salinus]|uniref:lamin tail domain-containing protein n=1 Tax=Halorussus salinus TaxID=1364935 RepID=UPI0010923CC7|nr:lamin tail domain-containing protein [Halorussus salinus]
MGVTDTNPWTTRTTTDHDEIREWVEARDAEPTHVQQTGEGDDLGVLRIDFPDDGPDRNLEAVPWDRFFGKFEEADLAFRYQNEKKNGERSYFHRFVSRDVMPGRTKTTTDREAIREWAEKRDATPAHVVGTGEGDDVGILRLDFPEEDPDPRLDAISWEQFFEKFDRERLALRYQDTKKSGERSDFHRFVNREATGVADVPEADVAVVAVETVPVAGGETGADRDTAEEADRDAADDETSPDTDPARGSTAEGVPDEVLGNRRPRVPRLTAGLVVDEIHENARGYDHWNKNDEYVVLRNEADDPLDLTGWTVENSDGTTYEFPDEFLLDPNRSVTIHSGSGEDADDHLFWGSSRAVWKNTGDVVTVRDETDRRVIRVSY